MEKQNNLNEPNKTTVEVTPPQTLPIQGYPAKTSPKPTKYIVFGLVGVLLLVAMVGGLYIQSQNNTTTSKKLVSNTQQQATPATNQENNQVSISLQSLFLSIQSTYDGNIPWTNINNRLAYKFYPKEINGLPVAIGEVSTSHDGNYNPLTVFKLTDTFSIPLKNAYISYFEVPDVLRKKFNLGDMDIAMPLELKVYEFDRKLNESESSIITKGENFKCTNEKSKTETASFTNSQMAIFYCNSNLTEEQKAQVKNRGFFDKIYEIYFVDRNLLIQFSADSTYINNPQDYLSDYMSKVFNSNDTLFVTQSQIKSVEDSRKFEEWRSKTFDKNN